MGKLETLKRGAGGNAAESTGAGVPLGQPIPETTGKPAHLEGIARSKNLVEIAIERIVRDPSQPREVFTEAELNDLAESIEKRGILQPIRVRWDGVLERYVIVAGERRWRAARQAGLKVLPCVIHEGAMTESLTLQDQLVENLLRQDLQPIETAKAYKRLLELEGWSNRQLARELHIPDSTIVRALALLDLPEVVQDQVAAGAIAPSVAYEVSKLERPEEQVALAKRVVEEKLTRDAVAGAVQGRGVKAVVALDDGRKVTITGLADNNPETVLAALQAASRKLRGKGAA